MTGETQREQYKDTPSDNARRWQMELKAAREKLAPWHKQAAEAVDASLMKRSSTEGDNRKRLAFFPANIQMQRAAMFGRAPRVTCTRRFADAKDDVARVASEIQERLLNTDIERDSDTTTEAVGNGLSDSLTVDFACVRARYVADFEDVPETPAILGVDGTEKAPVVPALRKKTREDVEIDYLHWRDVLWGPSRVWADVPWVAFLVLMTREELTEKFGKSAERVPLNAKRKGDDDDARKSHPWDRAEVWEIWEKSTKRVFWVVEGYDSVLTPEGVETDEGGAQPDPLGLEGFWPCPKFMILNASTSALVPMPDYAFTKDVYASLDTLETRCGLLVDALKVAGVYDKSMGVSIQGILDAGENKLIPADNWAMFAEKGGIRGAIDWFPMEQVANTLNSLRDVMREKQDLLYQLTGRSDLERGQATQAGATATEQRAKVKYGSVRMQRRQDEFARFVSDVQRIKAQIISMRFDAQTILERCNCQYTPDFKVPAPDGRPLPVAAVDLLKSQSWQFRIEVKPEQLALQDFGALKEEAMEVLTSIGGYANSITPLVGLMGPDSATVFLEILQTSLARIKGGSVFESILDRAIDTFEQKQAQAAANPQPAPEDPKLQAERIKAQTQQMKGQMDMQKEQVKLQNDLVRTQAEVQADAMRENTQREQNVREAAQKQMVVNALKPPAPPPTNRGGFP